MTTQDWSTAPFTIHVNGDPSRIIERASSKGALVLRWKLAGIRNQRQLDASAAEVFSFPFPSASAAGLVDMLSDLEWLDVRSGVLLIVDAAAAKASVIEIVAKILPGVVDRWRSGPAPCEVWMVGVEATPRLAAVLEQRNVELDEFGRLPWSRSDIYRVPVVFH